MSCVRAGRKVQREAREKLDHPQNLYFGMPALPFPHSEQAGCGALGPCSPYVCAPHAQGEPCMLLPEITSVFPWE